jgi:fatty-acyl-CoA synthase
MAVWEVGGPIRGVADIAALEAVPLEQRITDWDIASWLWHGLTASPGKLALRYFAQADPDATPVDVTYAELVERTDRIAHLLLACGVGRRDPVLFLAPPVPDAYALLAASLTIGVAAPVNWMLEPAHLLGLIRGSGARVVVALGPTPGFEVWDKLSAIRAELPEDVRVFSLAAPGGEVLPEDLMVAAAAFPATPPPRSPRSADDVVAYIHSGGTTGAPKIVQLTSRGFVHKIWSITVTMAHRPSDVLLADMPLFHIAGFIHSALQPLVHGATLVVPSPHGARDRALTANYWKFVDRFRVSFLHGVPATLTVLSQNPPTTEDVSCLAPWSTTGSTALPVSVAETIRDRMGIRLVATYGATEFCMNATQAPRDGDPKFGSCGIRNPYSQIRIVRRRDGGVQECAPGETGHVLVRTPGNTPGYLGISRDPTVFLADGWIDNGDLGMLDADGYLWITGRAKDVIIRGGHNIDPRITEEALLSHPAVAEAGAVGWPDARLGELPVAYVALKQGAVATQEELVAHARAHASERAAAPQTVIIVPELPRTDVRKLDRVKLRADAARRAFVALLEGLDAEVSAAADADGVLRLRVTVPEDAMLEAAERLRGQTLAYEIVQRG